MDRVPESSRPTAFRRLTRGWVYGGFLAGLLFLLLAPVILSGMPLAFVLVVLQLPLYMLHQYEEHDADRFRTFINQQVGGGHDVLSSADVFVINIGGVWLLDAAVIWLAATVDIGFGLIAVYAALVNAVVHGLVAAATRRYNPGLVTAIMLLLPASIVGAYAVTVWGGASAAWHLLGVLVAVALHAAIGAHVLRNRRRLARA